MAGVKGPGNASMNPRLRTCITFGGLWGLWSGECRIGVSFGWMWAETLPTAWSQGPSAG